MRAVGIPMRMAPGKVGRPGYRHLKFELLIIRAKSFIGDRPIRSETIARVDLEIGRMKARREGRPVNGTSAYALAAVVRAKGEGIRAAGDAKIFPVEFVRSGFVADPVAFCVPEGASFKRDYSEPSAAQALKKNTTRGSASDDQVVNFVRIAVAAHRKVDLLKRSQLMMAVS